MKCLKRWRRKVGGECGHRGGKKIRWSRGDSSTFRLQELEIVRGEGKCRDGEKIRGLVAIMEVKKRNG